MKWIKLLYRRVVFSRQGGFTPDRNHPNTTTKVSIYHLPFSLASPAKREQNGVVGLKLDTREQNGGGGLKLDTLR